MLNTKAAIAEMDEVMGQWEEARKQSKYDDLSDLRNGMLAELVTSLSFSIEKFAPPGSAYRRRADEILDKFGPGNYSGAHQPLYGVLSSLRKTYANGYLTTVAELIHADLFADFLEMAEHLLNEKYKDAAAVTIGGALESHLRQLANKHNVPIKNAKGDPRKSSSINDDLAKVAYDKLQQKGVTFWLDIRNKAAHGKYGQYDEHDVRTMLQGVQGFIDKFRA